MTTETAYPKAASRPVRSARGPVPNRFLVAELRIAAAMRVRDPAAGVTRNCILMRRATALPADRPLCLRTVAILRVKVPLTRLLPRIARRLNNEWL